jgi:hypothetical protein
MIRDHDGLVEAPQYWSWVRPRGGSWFLTSWATTESESARLANAWAERLQMGLYDQVTLPIGIVPVRRIRDVEEGPVKPNPTKGPGAAHAVPAGPAKGVPDDTQDS